MSTYIIFKESREKSSGTWQQNAYYYIYMNLDDLVNPINKQKLDRDNIEYFFGIPNLYFDDENH